MLKKETIYRDAKIMWVASILFAISLIVTTFLPKQLAPHPIGYGFLVFCFFVVAYLNVVFIFYSIATIESAKDLKNNYPKTKTEQIKAFSNNIDDPFKDKHLFNQVRNVIVVITILFIIADILHTYFNWSLDIVLLLINVIPLLETMLSALFTLFCMHFNWVLSDHIKNHGIKPL